VGSAFNLSGRDKSLGGAFLYESKGAQTCARGWGRSRRAA